MPKFTDVELRALGIGEHTDGDGLNFVVAPSRKKGGKLLRKWVFRIQIGGKRAKFGLGSFPSVGARQSAPEGYGRPVVSSPKELIPPSAQNAVRASLRPRARSPSALRLTPISPRPRPRSRTPRHPQIRDRALRVHFAPLHSREVASIMVADVADILRPLKPNTAVKSHAAIRAVFDFAATTLEPHGVTIVNPADPRRLRSLGWSPKSIAGGHAASGARLAADA